MGVNPLLGFYLSRITFISLNLLLHSFALRIPTFMCKRTYECIKSRVHGGHR